MKEDRFTYGKDAPKIEVSQCSNCDHNIGLDDCDRYGTKPDIYAYNDEDCPEKSS